MTVLFIARHLFYTVIIFKIQLVTIFYFVLWLKFFIMNKENEVNSLTSILPNIPPLSPFIIINNTECIVCKNVLNQVVVYFNIKVLFVNTIKYLRDEKKF